MKTLVTGGAGFIGSHLCELLLKKGHFVIALDNLSGGKEKNLHSFKANKAFTLVEADIRQVESLAPHFEDIEWVFHLAALADIVPSIEKPRDYFETNVDGTFNVLECARKAGVKRFLYAASSSCYGIPDTFPTSETAPIQAQYPYALTKHLGENLVMHWEKIYGLPSISLRLFNVFGPRARTSGAYGAVFGVFLAQKLNNKPLTVVGDGTQTRDFTFVEDVVRAFYLAAKSSHSGEIMNVGSGHHHSINTIVKLLDNKAVHIPKRPGEPDCTFADITKIQNLLSFKPKVPFKEGVKRILDQIELFRDAPVWEAEGIQEATKTWFKHLSTESTDVSRSI